MAARIKLDTKRQAVRLASGLVVLFGFAVLFAYAALVTADSVGKQVGAWAVCGLFVVFGTVIAVSGAIAMRSQFWVVSDAGIAREAANQPWLIGWSEIEAVAVEKSWRYAGYRDYAYPKFLQPKVWRVVVRIAPTDPAAFAAAHEVLSGYRARFGASADEWGIWLGPPRELIPPLDEALRAYSGGKYRGVADLGEAPDWILTPTGAYPSLRNRSS